MKEEEIDFRDRVSWEAERAKRSAEARRSVASEALGRLRQAEVPFENLTDDPNWNFFLSLIQARLEVRRNSLEQMQRSELTMLDFNHANMATEKAARQIQHAVIEALEEILAIPKRLREAGQEAARAAYPADPSA